MKRTLFGIEITGKSLVVFSVGCLFVVVSIFYLCSLRREQIDEKGEVKAATIQKPKKESINSNDLSKYPAKDRIKVGGSLGVISPGFQQRVELPVSAQVILKFDGAGASFKKGELWAEVDPDRLKIEAQRIALFKDELKSGAGVLDAKTQAMQMQSRAREIERSLVLMDMPESESDISGGDDLKLLKENAAKARKNMIEEKELIAEKLRTIIPDAEARERAKANDLAARELDYRRLVEASQLTMPCDGRVSLLLPGEKGRNEFSVKAGMQFAEVVDDSRYFVCVPVSAQSWRSVPQPELRVSVKAASGLKIEARFLESRQGKFLGRDEQLYVFEFSKTDIGAVRNLAGGMITCEIVRKIPQSIIIPKLQLVCEHKDNFTDSDWGDAIPKIWDGYRMVAEGESEIAISK